MLEFAQPLYDGLLLKLEDLENEEGRLAFSTELALVHIETAIERIKDELKNHRFCSVEDEVQFFKSVLPSFLSLLIYYTEKARLESTALIVNPETRNEHLERLFQRMDDFYKENAEFLRYYRSGKANLDECYFLRSSLLNQENTGPLMDLSLCNIYSVKVATQQAYTRMEQDIRRQFTGPQEERKPSTHSGVKLKWTDTKTDMIELIYSLEAKGTFNEGKADIKDITEVFENTFSIQLGNTSSSFQQILCRKKGYTIYLDKLRDELLRKIDDIERRNIR